MNSGRYPDGLVVTTQDFIDCGWRTVLDSATREGYPSMWQAFAGAAKKAIDENRLAHGKVLWLLADACSMMLAPDSPSEPFRPIMVLQGRRTTIVDDLSDADISFYAQIVEVFDDPWLNARLADIVWHKQKPREVKYALMAIDSYRRIPLETDIWVSGGDECWKRAIALAILLKKGAGSRLKEMEHDVLMAFGWATREDGFLACWLAVLLDSNGLGNSAIDEIAQKLESLASEFDRDSDLNRSRGYFEESRKWFQKAENVSKTTSMTAAVAETWVKEAARRLESKDPSNMVAATFYEKAIQIYRTIPHSERGPHRTAERLEELRTKLSDAGEKSLGEMRPISVPGADISQIVGSARSAVGGKAAVEALRAFANLCRTANCNEMRQNALTMLNEHPLQALFGNSVLSQDGRVIAKAKGLSHGAEPTEDDEITIRTTMIREYGIMVGINVLGNILPALEVLLLEQHLKEPDFISLCRQSPIVPVGRARLFGKALFAGYDRDFISALHLLTPQIENMVRYHLKQAGAKTTNLDQQGIENENGLSTLIELPEAERVFGPDLVFEIKTLFCDSFGSNLRNEISHGLLNDDSFQSAAVVYAWWLGLKLVFNTFWNAARKPAEAGGEGQEE
ncbi:MAG: DUF4209 domain-containing protein [Pseudomonadota bacterium]